MLTVVIYLPETLPSGCSPPRQLSRQASSGLGSAMRQWPTTRLGSHLAGQWVLTSSVTVRELQNGGGRSGTPASSHMCWEEAPKSKTWGPSVKSYIWDSQPQPGFYDSVPLTSFRVMMLGCWPYRRRISISSEGSLLLLSMT